MAPLNFSLFSLRVDLRLSIMKRGGLSLDIEQFEGIALNVSLIGLFCFMFFIVYDLAKNSKAGKLGGFVLFFALCLGMLGFLMKGFVAQFFGLE